MKWLRSFFQILSPQFAKCTLCSLELGRGTSNVNSFFGHLKNNHKEDEPKVTKQYNCNDCSFQGENSLELKRHIQRTMHTPCEYMEECFTCSKEFSSYWLLMNHRKADHPSVKKCRYFLNGECKFNAETCWYKHEVNLKPEERKEVYDTICD